GRRGVGGGMRPRGRRALGPTPAIDHYRVEAPGLLTVGSGAVLWDIRDFAAAGGWQLPVYNGGWAGPSLGGFVSAGGLGLRVPAHARGQDAPPGDVAAAATLSPVSLSERHGGLWAQVARLTVIDGLGKVHGIPAGDPDFPWMFASMGQFGLILEATLRLLPLPGATDGLPAGSTGRVPASNPDHPGETDLPAPAHGIDWVYWFTALAPLAEEVAAWKVIGDWSAAHRRALHPTGGWAGPLQDGEPIGFRYVVRRKAPTPPLLYPRDKDFVAVGVMAVCHGIGTDQAEVALTEAEQDFVSRIVGGGWALYCQAENLTRSLDFRSYLGSDRWAKFRALKTRFDPDERVNAGEVLPDSRGAPMRASRARKLAAAIRRSLGLPLPTAAPPSSDP
ncbi:MAG: hypothetical protein OXC11_13570, partial [Rhodospirillales bacterium]|nr:hypothetical protein [Rhodospirillales bacterium]